MANEWTFEATRDCGACGGTGRTPMKRTGPGQTEYRQGPPPVECETCDGKGREKRRYTLAELRAALSGVG